MYLFFRELLHGITSVIRLLDTGYVHGLDHLSSFFEKLSKLIFWSEWKLNVIRPLALIISVEIPRIFGHMIGPPCCEASFLEKCQNSFFFVRVETSYEF